MKLEFQKIVLFLDQHGIKYDTHYFETSGILRLIAEDFAEFQFDKHGTIYVSTGCVFEKYDNASEALEYALRFGYPKHKEGVT